MAGVLRSVQRAGRGRTGTQAEIAKLEGQVEAGAKQVQELVEENAKSAPAGFEPAVAALKSALKTVGSVYESAQKAAKPAAEIAESGIAAAASAAGRYKPMEQ